MITRGDTALPESTLLANCKQILMYISSENGQNTWMTSNNLQEEAQILFQYMCMADQRSDIPLSATSGWELVDAPDLRTGQNTPAHIERLSFFEMICEKVQNILNNIKKGSATAQMPNLDSDIKLQSEKDHPISTPKNTLQESLQYKDIVSTFDSLIQAGRNSKLAQVFESSMMVNILDIGGQPGFLEMIPSLINGPAVYLVFLNLSLPLHQPYKIPFSRDNAAINPFPSEYTVESTISQILSAVSSIDQQASSTITLSAELQNFRATKPVASIVGTHLDKLDDGTMPIEEHLKQNTRKLRRSLTISTK